MKMKRRTFAVLAGTSLAALKTHAAEAQTADASLLTTTLTPMGSERAGNTDGSIPAWTGGYTTVPEGWQPSDYMPDPFANEQPVVVINASNMSQYAEKLSDGVQALMTKSGFSIKVYPSHRTQSVPASVASYIAQNVTSTKLVDPANPQSGFTSGFGGYPFPIPDASNPLAAGAQVIYNHNNRWGGYAQGLRTSGYVVNNGQLVLTLQGPIKYDYPFYYRKDIATLQGREFLHFTGPGNLVGEEIAVWYHTDLVPQQSWELLNGQGRVRLAPELSFDTPSSFADGVNNIDEYFGFNGQLIEYDWKSLGKQELYIPYNNNAVFLQSPEELLQPKFVNPDIVRWELHRVWVVEATLHAGKRNVLARRRFYVDEDTWTIGVTDSWDANGNLYRTNHVFNLLRPDLPGLVFGNNVIYNLQTGDYALPNGPYNEKANPSFRFYDSWPDSTFDPQNMAASAQY
jgi:hypothetical protein